MSTERQQRIEHIFHLASEMPKAEQSTFVHQQLVDDPQAIDEVLELLALNDEDSVLLDRVLNSPQQVSQAVMHKHQLNRVGSYLIVKEISHGGMGRVFLGRRDDQAYESMVAIKLVRVERNSEWAEKRFLEERQILAKLNHPNIATLLDGGTTEQGQPYVVMQYIDGISITDYSQQQQLDIKSKLEVFKKVAKAVSHAHKNLVIHRDIKPANILVTTEGEPKLLDFGIAKMISTDLNGSDVTQMGIMTPSYASPEQVRGESISTASDIYSLGILLYELLAEVPAFDVGSGSPAEIVKAVCGTQPIAPSKKAKQPQLVKILSGDLDNIVLKAIQKDPDRRYGSADEFISDINNYQSGHPVTAVGDSAWYRSKKFCQRHFWGLAASTVFLLSITAVVTFYTIQLTQQRDRALAAEAAAKAATEQAQQESVKAIKVSEFLSDLFAANDPSAGIGGKNMTARELLDFGSQSITASLVDEPLTKADLLITIGIAYFNLGFLDKGIVHMREALALKKAHAEPPEIAESMNRLANLLRQADRYDEAVNMHREAISLHESYSHEPTWEQADAYNNFGLLIYSLGQYDEAEHYLKKAIVTHRAAAGGKDVASVGINMHNLSLILRVMGKYQEAESMIRESLDITEAHREGGADSSSWAISLQQLGRIENDLGRYNDALMTLQLALEKHQAIYEPNNRRVGTVWSRIANSHHALGNHALAVEHYERALNIFRESQGIDSSLAVYTETEYASLLREMGQLDDGETVLRHTLRVNQEMYIPTHPNTALTAAELALVLAEKDQLTEAEALIETAITGFETHLENDHPQLAWARLINAKINRLSSHHAAAKQMLDASIKTLTAKRNQNPRYYTQALYEQALAEQTNNLCEIIPDLNQKAAAVLEPLNDQHPLLSWWATFNQCNQMPQSSNNNK